MTYYEKYKDSTFKGIVDVKAVANIFAVDNNNLPVLCAKLHCSKCKFDCKFDCLRQMLNWLNAECEQEETNNYKPQEETSDYDAIIDELERKRRVYEKNVTTQIEYRRGFLDGVRAMTNAAELIVLKHNKEGNADVSRQNNNNH